MRIYSVNKIWFPQFPLVIVFESGKMAGRGGSQSRYFLLVQECFVNGKTVFYTFLPLHGKEDRQVACDLFNLATHSQLRYRYHNGYPNKPSANDYHFFLSPQAFHRYYGLGLNPTIEGGDKEWTRADADIFFTMITIQKQMMNQEKRNRMDNNPQITVVVMAGQFTHVPALPCSWIDPRGYRGPELEQIKRCNNRVADLILPLFEGIGAVRWGYTIERMVANDPQCQSLSFLPYEDDIVERHRDDPRTSGGRKRELKYRSPRPRRFDEDNYRGRSNEEHRGHSPSPRPRPEKRQRRSHSEEKPSDQQRHKEKEKEEEKEKEKVPRNVKSSPSPSPAPSSNRRGNIVSERDGNGSGSDEEEGEERAAPVVQQSIPTPGRDEGGSGGGEDSHTVGALVTGPGSYEEEPYPDNFFEGIEGETEESEVLRQMAADAAATHWSSSSSTSKDSEMPSNERTQQKQPLPSQPPASRIINLRSVNRKTLQVVKPVAVQHRGRGRWRRFPINNRVY